MLIHRCLRSAVCAFIAIFVAATASLAATGAVLKHNQRLGDKSRYDLTYSAHAKIDLQKGLTTSEADMNMKLECLAEYLGATSEGVAKVRGQFLSGSLKVTAEGEEETVPLDRAVMNYQITPEGDIKQAELVAGELPVFPGIWVVVAPDDAFLLGGLAQFPKRELNVGDKWQGTASIPLPTGEPGRARAVNFDSKILGQQQYGGATCFKIKTNRREESQQDLEVPDGAGRIHAKFGITASYTWLFDPARGVIMRSDETANLTATVRATDPSGAEATVKLSAVIQGRSVLTQLNGKDIPLK